MLDFLIILLFIAYSVYSGFRAKKVASENLQEYFLAGRTVKGWRAGISMAATQFSADTPMLFVGLVATGGFFMIWQLWIVGLSFLLMGFIFAAHWRRAAVLTDAELIEVRYSGKGLLALRTIKAIYYGTLINCVVMSFVMLALIRYSEVFLLWHEWLPQGLYSTLSSYIKDLDLNIGEATDLPILIATTNNIISILVVIAFTTLYSATGGLRAVISTDIMQFVLALVGTIGYAYVVLYHVGGIDQLGPKLVNIYGAEHASQMTSFIPTDPDLLLPILAIIALQWFFQMNSDGTGYLAQRSMACISDKDARMAAIIFTWVQILLRSLIWIVIAVALLILFPFDIQHMSGNAELFKADRELVFVQGIERYIPSGLLGIVLAGLLGALASTVDTHLNWGAGYWSNDIYKRFLCEHLLKRNPSGHELVLVARLSNILTIVLSLYIMTQMASLQQAWKTSLLFGAGVGSVLVMRWLWERINLYSEMAAMAVSLIAGVLLLKYLPENHQEWIRLGLMALISTTAAISITFFTPATDTKVLNAFYCRVSPVGWWPSTARRCGCESSKSIARLKLAIKLTFFCALSLYLLLVGLTRLILNMPDTSILLSVSLIGIGGLLIPFWWRHVFCSGEELQ